MYADPITGSRFDTGRFHPAGLAAAIGINAAVVAALLVAVPHFAPKPPATPFESYAVPLDPPPPEPVPPPETARRQAPRPAARPDAPIALVETPTRDVGIVGPVDPLPFPGPDLAGTSTTPGGALTTEPARPAPVIVGPALDPRYADDLQPAYPAAEQRLDREGKVTVRILVGADGRVRQVERVSATSDAFFRATENQALRRWRFKPGTRDGMAEAAWRTMTVTFVLDN